MKKTVYYWQLLLQIFGLTTKQYWISFFEVLIMIVLSHIFLLAMTNPDYGFFVFTGIVYLCNLPFIPFTQYAFKNKLNSPPITWKKKIIDVEPQYTYISFIIALISPVIFFLILFNQYLKNKRRRT